jgi:hypothetical protein
VACRVENILALHRKELLVLVLELSITDFFSLYRYLLSCHLLREAFPDHLC